MSTKPDFLEFITPIGRLVHCFVDKAQVETSDLAGKVPKLDDDGDPIAYFKTTVMWPKSFMTSELIPFRQLAAQAKKAKWPDTDPKWFVLQPFLRDGDNPEHNTKAREYLFDHVYLTFKAKGKKFKDPSGKIIRYDGAPGLIGPYNEDLLSIDVWSGCYARVSGIMFGSEYMGKNFISVRLNNIQKGGGPNNDGSGERIGGGGRPDARSQFDPLMSRDDDIMGGSRHVTDDII